MKTIYVYPTTTKAVGQVVEALVLNDARRATKYLSDKSVVTAARRLTKGEIDKKDSRIDIVLKIGEPNYQEREFIKQCKKAGEPFPVKKVQLKFPKKQK